ncbi:MAG: xanthine dehydrogenase family protein molybdopterin-binding subunit, partial [Candidatus Competibacteraceae bacterium]|nr:xanthine dehydrogenase family protein molybdopterin-binding subunit [Candidatus Competibacteraceae bacterium]
MNQPHNAIPRVDGTLKVTGRAQYSIDISLPQMVHAQLVTSTISQGRISFIDTSAAEEIPGVLLVLTHQNAERLQPLDFPQPGQPPSSAGNGFLPLQDDRVRFNGQAVALVVAETAQQAREAAARVTVSYDAEPHQTEMRTALHAAFKPREGGFGEDPDYARGSVKNGLREAKAVIHTVYDTPTVHHNVIGPYATVATWEDGCLTVHDATQGVFPERKRLARWLGLDSDQVRVIGPYMGGGFGSGLRTNAHTLLAAMAARRLARPVKLVLTRRQMFTAVGHRPASRHELVLGARSDGTLTAIRHDVQHATSQHDEYIDLNTEVTRMLYACPNLAASTRLVRLDIDTPCPMRAPPQVNGVFALESALDELAYALKMDPVELRLRNHADRDPDRDLPWSSKSLKECYHRGMAAIGWERRTAQPRSMSRDGRLIGLGMATTTYPVHRSAAGARAQVGSDGIVRVASGSTDIGPGTVTVMAQLAAETLDLPVERVIFELGDTRLPQAPLQGGSMTLASVGMAVRSVCQKLLARLEELSGGRADLEPAALKNLLAQQGLERLEVETRIKGGAPKDYSCHGFGAHFVQVAVDPLTGEVRLERLVGAFACGRIVNP